jgi:hypothetical protein
MLVGTEHSIRSPWYLSRVVSIVDGLTIAIVLLTSDQTAEVFRAIALLTLWSKHSRKGRRGRGLEDIRIGLRGELKICEMSLPVSSLRAQHSRRSMSLASPVRL